MILTPLLQYDFHTIPQDGDQVITAPPPSLIPTPVQTPAPTSIQRRIATSPPTSAPAPSVTSSTQQLVTKYGAATKFIQQKFNATKTTVHVDGTIRTNHVYAACHKTTGQIYSNQIGQFTILSSSGNKYVFLLYNHDSGYIDARTMATKTKEQIIKAYKESIAMLKTRGFKPKLQCLDNKAYKALIHEIESEDIGIQLTPVGLH